VNNIKRANEPPPQSDSHSSTNRTPESEHHVSQLLTKRELEVLSLISQGYSSKRTAEVLVISKRTVDFHLTNVFQKLKVRNRVQAYIEGTRLGLLKND